MTAKDLRSLLFDIPEDSEIVVLNENAPIKVAAPVYQTFTLKGAPVAKWYLCIRIKTERKVRSNGY